MANTIIDNKFREILLPTMLIAMALNITALVDSSFVANFIGHYGQAALQVFEPLVLLITIFEWLFGLGGQILSLNKKAEFDEEGSNHYFTVAIAATIIISVIFMIVCFAFKTQIIGLLNPTPEVVPYVSDYATFAFLSFPLATILAVLTQFVRVDGQPNLASALIILANIINITLDYVFLGVFHTGIAGASIATTIGYAVAMICVLKYHFNPKRTFRFTKLKIKSGIKSTVEIIKIGSPGASIGLFDVILVYVMNFIIISVSGTAGLNIFNVCVNSLLVISIIVIGVSESLSSIVPVYYVQNDFYNLYHIIKKALLTTLACAVAFMVFLWIYPDGFLMLFNLQQMPDVDTALRLYSLAFIPYVPVCILIFYYEAIERFITSFVVAVISGLIGPLLSVFILYQLIGVNGIWLSFLGGAILALLAALVYSRIEERKEKEYYGLFYIKKDLISKTRNYELKNSDEATKEEIYNHLRSLGAELRKLESLIEYIFENNEDNILIDVVIIDYNDSITVNLKDEGKKDIIKDNPEFSGDDDISCSEVFGFNNIKLTIPKSD